MTAFDVDPETLEVVRAPRCVSLLGDHTDPSDGLILGAAIGPETWIAFRRRRDGLVRLSGRRPAVEGEFWIDSVSVDSRPARARATAVDFVAGSAWSLREAGLPVRGMEGVIDSADPRVGLGWLASVQLAGALALLGGGRIVEASLLASLAHRAEHEYIGRADGMAEHFLSAAGRTGRAVLLDCRSLETHHVTLPPGMRVVVSETAGPQRRHGVLAERRAECGRAMALLSERMPGLMSLRDLDMASLKRHRTALPEPLVLRVEHIVSENLRVLAAAAALETGDLDESCRLLTESNDSLRNLYGIGSAELDALVEIAGAVPGVVGSRMTGRAGTLVVSLVLADAVPALIASVEREYPNRTGFAGRAREVAVVDGAGRVA